MDRALTLAIHHWFAPSPLGPFMAWITDPENWYIPIGLLMAALIAVSWRRGLAAIVIALAAVGVGDGMGHYLIKPLFARPRPCIALPDEIVPLVGCVDSYSFPSNHAINSMAAAVALGMFFPKLRWPLVGLAALVAVSRVVVGAHYVADVTAGALLGAFLGWGMARVARRFGAPFPQQVNACPE
ncbi:MAG: phosphatase PAP2 family protein [Nitrospinae bacterium]|nr:phosphatase PAP2 family protein [Nitrospinota bacterium]